MRRRIVNRFGRSFKTIASHAACAADQNGPGWRVALVPVVAAALTACGAAEEKSRTAPPLQVEAFRVSSEPEISTRLNFPVVVQRDRESDLSVRVGGVIRTLPARIGDQLPRGYAIAAIEAQNFNAERARIIARRDHLRSEVARSRKLLEIGAISTSQLDASLAELRASDAALMAADYDLQSTVVKMPYQGVVLSLSAEMGEVVLPGKPIARVADSTSALVAKAKVPASTAMQLRQGQSATVTLPGMNRPIIARVLRIGQSSDLRTATVDVDLLLPSKVAQWPSGTVGSARFVIASRAPNDQHQRVPVEALLDVKGDVGHVYVVDLKMNTARLTRVRVIGLDGDWLKLCCLPADALVITNGAGFVENGQRVSVTAQ